MLCEAKVKYGRERAAASVLDVVAEDAEEGGCVLVGEVGVAAPPTDPDTLWEEPCLGACWRRNCRAFARAFSCVRTK